MVFVVEDFAFLKTFQNPVDESFIGAPFISIFFGFIVDPIKVYSIQFIAHSSIITYR